MNLYKTGLLLVLLLITACTGSSVTTVRYETEATGSQRSEGPVAELQRKALAALDQRNYQQSVEYLQRAIKIEPRNAFTWHYLAQTYWHSNNFDRCLDMLNRSISYSTQEDNLDEANATLMSHCQES